METYFYHSVRSKHAASLSERTLFKVEARLALAVSPKFLHKVGIRSGIVARASFRISPYADICQHWRAGLRRLHRALSKATTPAPREARLAPEIFPIQSDPAILQDFFSNQGNV